MNTYVFDANLELRHIAHEDRIAVYHEKKIAEDDFFAPATALILNNANDYVVAFFSNTLHCTNAESFTDYQKAWKTFDAYKGEVQTETKATSCQQLKEELEKFRDQGTVITSDRPDKAEFGFWLDPIEKWVVISTTDFEKTFDQVRDDPLYSKLENCLGRVEIAKDLSKQIFTVTNP